MQGTRSGAQHHPCHQVGPFSPPRGSSQGPWGGGGLEAGRSGVCGVKWVIARGDREQGGAWPSVFSYEQKGRALAFISAVYTAVIVHVDDIVVHVIRVMSFDILLPFGRSQGSPGSPLHTQPTGRSLDLGSLVSCHV